MWLLTTIKEDKTLTYDVIMTSQQIVRFRAGSGGGGSGSGVVGQRSERGA